MVPPTGMTPAVCPPLKYGLDFSILNLANKMERDLLGAFPLVPALAPCYFGTVCYVHFAGEAIDGHSRTGTL